METTVHNRMEALVDRNVERLIKKTVGDKLIHHVNITSYGICVTFYDDDNSLDFVTIGWSTLDDWSMKYGGV